MSNHLPQASGPSWSTPRPAPWVTGLTPPEMAVAELGPQESSYTRNLGAVYESMVIDGFEDYSTTPYAQVNNSHRYDTGMEVDPPTASSDPMEVDVVTGASSYTQATAGYSGSYYCEEPRTPRRRPLGRAITVACNTEENFSPTKSLVRTRSYAVLTAVTNTPKRNPTMPYTPQRTQRKPSASHSILETRQHDGSPYCPPTTPRRKRRVVDPDIDPLFNELTEHQIELLTQRLAALRIGYNDSDDETGWDDTLSECASYLSVAGSSDTTVVPPLLERLAFKDLSEDDDLDAALEYLRDVMKDAHRD